MPDALVASRVVHDLDADVPQHGAVVPGRERRLVETCPNAETACSVVVCAPAVPAPFTSAKFCSCAAPS